MRELKITRSITNRDSAAVEKYLKEISKYTIPTDEEEVNLALRIKTGDAVALDRLVKGNLRFVVSVAKQYQHLGLTLLELINEGNIGLIKAAERFDETRGFKFISYAVWRIRQSILAALAEQGRMVRTPTNVNNFRGKVTKQISRLEQILEREPTPEEIIEAFHELGKTDEKFKKYQTRTAEDVIVVLGTAHTSLDAPVNNEDGEATFGDFLTDTHSNFSTTKELDQEDLEKELKALMSRVLTQRQQEVLTSLWGLFGHEKLSLQDLGEKYNLEKERIRQIKDKAIIKLQSSPTTKKILSGEAKRVPYSPSIPHTHPSKPTTSTSSTTNNLQASKPKAPITPPVQQSTRSYTERIPNTAERIRQDEKIIAELYMATASLQSSHKQLSLPYVSRSLSTCLHQTLMGFTRYQGEPENSRGHEKLRHYISSLYQKIYLKSTDTQDRTSFDYLLWYAQYKTDDRYGRTTLRNIVSRRLETHKDDTRNGGG